MFGRLRSFWNGPFSGDMLVAFFWAQIEVQFNDLINTFQQGIELGATHLSLSVVVPFGKRHVLQSLTNMSMYKYSQICTYSHIYMYTYMKTNVNVYIKTNRGNEVKQMLTATGIICCTKKIKQVKQLEINWNGILVFQAMSTYSQTHIHVQVHLRSKFA